MRLKLLLLAEVLDQRAAAFHHGGNPDAAAALEAVEEALREVLDYRPDSDDPQLEVYRESLGLPRRRHADPD